MICVNKFPTDTKEELDAICESCKTFPNVQDAIVGDHWANGGQGTKDLAAACIQTLDGPWDQITDSNPWKPLYPDDMPIKEKIETVAREIYR